MSRHFARNGYHLFWASLSENEIAAAKLRLLEEIPDATVSHKAIDLCRHGAVEEVYDWTKSLGQVDVLINNAGIGTYGYLQNIQVEKELNMIELNVLSVYKMTRKFLADMIDRDDGVIINISSIASKQPVARMNTYAATKAFIRHFSMGLQEELVLQKSKVRVMTVFPAAICDTPFKTTGGMEKVKTFKGLAYTTAQEVGEDVWKAYTNKRRKITTGYKMRWIETVEFLMPNALKRLLVQRETETDK